MKDFIDNLTDKIGFIASILSILLAILIGYDTTMRYLFSEGSIALQEVEWHIFDIVFLLGLSYALQYDKHVRVDIFFVKYSSQTRAIIQILSMTFLLIPFSLFFIQGSLDMTIQSFLQNEVSSDPGGLRYRFIIKGILLLSFILLIFQAISEMIKAYSKIDDKKLLLLTIGGAIAIFGIMFLHLPFLINPLWIMFLLTLFLLMSGFQVAFVFAGVALIFALISEDLGLEVLDMLPYRVYGIMGNVTLMAIPLFILMGLILEKSKIAEDLLLSMGKLFGGIRGGLAISIVMVGAILAASTGIVGASVVMMSLIALPLMLKNGYRAELATGSIVASGTLGQIIPPSIVLIVLGDQMHLSVGDLFKSAVVPGILLIILYIIYILIYARLNPEVAPAIESNQKYSIMLKDAIRVITPPLLLILAVLGSIFAGVASPTESASIGVIGALILTVINGEFSFKLLKYASFETVKLTSMIFMILIGATAFSLVFNELGGQDIALDFFANDMGSRWGFIIFAMLIIFILGFFIDFIEIAFVVVPILVPIIHSFGIDPIWFAILIALNLQASFLTPPFGFALFYLKGASGNLVTTGQIYRGIIPFIGLQLLALLIILLFPNLIYIFGK
jgi:tripartite ATP-independent transporter DctM subunit